jgi:hypothetical protein
VRDAERGWQQTAPVAVPVLSVDGTTAAATRTNMSEKMILVDLWSLFWHSWYRLEGDDQTVSAQVLSYLRFYWREYDYMGVAIRSDTSWRDPVREELDAVPSAKPKAGLALLRSIVDSLERAHSTSGNKLHLLRGDGLESLDVITSTIERVATTFDRKRALQLAPEITVLSGKLMARQLARELPLPRVEVLDLSENRWTESAIEKGHGVHRREWPELLAYQQLKGIGEKRAVQLLKATVKNRAGKEYVPGFIELASRVGQGLPLSHLPHSQALVEDGFVTGKLMSARRVFTLEKSNTIDIGGLLNPKAAKKNSQEEDGMSVEDEEYVDERETEQAPHTQPSQPSPPPSQPIPSSQRMLEAAGKPVGMELLHSSSAEWNRELEPRTHNDAKRLAKTVMDSRLFSAYGTPQAAFLVIMAGREFGLGAMASLRSFHIVEGRPCLSAQTMMGLCIRHPDCLFFRVSSATSDEVVVEAQRADWASPSTWSYTWKDAQLAGLVGKSNWKKFPRAMLTNRCIAEAARFWFPDVVGGLYDPDELE